MKIFKDSDFNSSFNEKITNAAKSWDLACTTYIAENGENMGNCVVGAGIVIKYLAPRCRTPKTKMIIHTPIVTQDANVYEATKDMILDLLKNEGIEATYTWGWAD